MEGNWKDLFYFHRRERNGIFVLSTIILLLLLSQYFMPLLVDKRLEKDTQYLEAYWAQLKKDSLAYCQKLEAKKAVRYQERIKQPVVSNSMKEEFNPNTSTVENWMQFDLTQKQAESILRYINKGGVFKEKKDILKLYVIDQEKYVQIEPFLKIIHAEKKEKPSFNLKQDSDKAVQKRIEILVELNSADTTALKKLKGIGSYYATRIVKYRDQLGGFYGVHQLFEIERMREETVVSILDQVTVDTNLIRKLHLNSDSAVRMVKHPYITWNMAIRIQDFRDFHKKYKSAHDLVKNGLLNEELYSKLVPYLEL